MLEARGIDVFYGKAQVLSDLSLSVTRGEVVALLGRNGAGKTTTLKALMQMLPVARGSVHLSGTEITGMAPYRVARAGLGYVPEERRIFTQLSVRENLEVGRQPARDDVPAWTEQGLFTLFPNLAERAEAPGRALSGGEQQMLSIARTLMGNPSVLLLDEPSEGIAPVIVTEMVRAIRRLKREGLTILLSEQTIPFARAVADRVAVIDHGRVVFEGTFDDLDAAPEIRADHLAV
ncbi:High-affinity branched-chain amino acid transport ATP-binding protein LivF [Roseivivax sp. THAF40]|uniref:ABC transporter ATP-binding protein n=1 Tax=unclassified Roseivivax TaxID=2639302 RepID=UPI001268D5AB|nr:MULTISPECIES: ABC transporter ATP-binding protein [unclassified Roseivivax]QFS84143.1 High-affinity branched-chain amino acid transport ATP-binding protein LivF [Roseivivax sp. THAF197b]QFT47971.1 High-affinity branched-chain amino acid transport ATP-binding protein LivF [Roseivivax sp. THAF40]